jgi:hypothetical protein
MAHRIWSNILELGYAILTSAGLTQARTFTLPDKDGTFAMLDDVAGSTNIFDWLNL